MHSPDCSWSELAVPASLPMRGGCRRSLSLRNTKFLLRNHTPLTAGVQVVMVHHSCPRQHLLLSLGVPSEEPQSYWHTTQQVTQDWNLPHWNWCKTNYSFSPLQVQKSSSGAPAPLRYGIQLGVTCPFPILASFGPSCLWLKGYNFAMFWGSFPRAVLLSA